MQIITRKAMKFFSPLLVVVTIGTLLAPAFSEARGAADTSSECSLSGPDLKAAKAYLKFKKLRASFLPSGVPDVYGKELNISFDKVQDAINKVRGYGPTHGKKEMKITLSGPDLERYVAIGSRIACQYCCNAKTLVRKDGQAACGCAHSIMMRGLTAYLIRNHPDLSNDRILEELETWKISYFPKQTLTARLQEMEKGGEEGIKEVLKEFPDFLPRMVGGC
jgi:hypothetical protein